MSEVNMAIMDLRPAQSGINTRIGGTTDPPSTATSAGETAIERKKRSIEPRATAAHSPETFQPTCIYRNLMITLCIDVPIRGGKVADVDDSPEPTKSPGRDFRRRRRVKVHTEVWSL